MSTRKQQSKPPQIMITTPNPSCDIIHKGHLDSIIRCGTIVVDEWHELMGLQTGTDGTLYQLPLTTECRASPNWETLAPSAVWKPWQCQPLLFPLFLFLKEETDTIQYP